MPATASRSRRLKGFFAAVRRGRGKMGQILGMIVGTTVFVPLAVYFAWKLIVLVFPYVILPIVAVG